MRRRALPVAFGLIAAATQVGFRVKYELMASLPDTLGILHNTVVCDVHWGTHWETRNDAGRLDIAESSAGGVSGSIEVDLRSEDVPRYLGQVLHVSARLNAPCHPDVAPC